MANLIMRDTLNPPNHTSLFAGFNLQMLTGLAASGKDMDLLARAVKVANAPEDDEMNNREEVEEAHHDTEEAQNINELVTPRGEGHDDFGDTSDKWHYNEIV